VRGVRIERWFVNEPAAGNTESTQLADSHLCQGFFSPGVLLATSCVCPVRTAEKLQGNAPDFDKAGQEFSSQAVTSLTDKTARYFFIEGARRLADETTYNAARTASLKKAFAEDNAMIEAQQRNIDMTPGWRFMPTTADQGVILFNRLVEKLAPEDSTRASVAPCPGAGIKET
jgi:vanillate O-demethylase monooxygenase subunit